MVTNFGTAIEPGPVRLGMYVVEVTLACNFFFCSLPFSSDLIFELAAVIDLMNPRFLYFLLDLVNCNRKGKGILTGKKLSTETGINGKKFM